MNFMRKRLLRYGLTVLLCFAVLGCTEQDTKENAMSDEAFLKLCKKGTAGQVRKALTSGANANARKENGVTALMWAAGHNTNPEVVKILLEGGADIHAKSGGNLDMTALMWAASRNTNPEVVKALLEGGADIHAKGGILGMTALMWAASRNTNPEVVKMLLIGGANVHAVDENGNDALWYVQQRVNDGAKEKIIQILRKY